MNRIQLQGNPRHTRLNQGGRTPQPNLTLLFKKNYVEQIIRGEKTATRRLSRPMVKAGGAYRIRIGFFDSLPDRIRVNRLNEQRRGDMTDEDAAKEGAPSLEEFRREWAQLYGAGDDQATVWVVEFEYIAPDRNI